MIFPSALLELPVLNLTCLLKIQADAHHNPVAASLRYVLSQAIIARIKVLSIERLIEIATRSDQSVLTFRTELLDLLEAPPILVGMLASTRIPFDGHTPSSVH